MRNEPQQSMGYKANIVGVRSSPQPTVNTFTVSQRTLRNLTAMNKQSDDEQQQQLNLETGQLY